jgi:predicted dehydrogenase
VHADHAQLLARDDVEIVDVATHPQPREQILADAIRAGKHALSQKPFVVDLEVGRKLVSAAKRRGVCLAVNQNGRWAPHFSYLRHAVAAGLIGDLVSIDIAIHWDHNWVHGTPFDRVPQLLLYDFAVHWFDMLHCLTPGRRPREVQARLFKGRHQTARPPLQASVEVWYPNLLATLVFRGSTPCGAYDKTVVVGTEGTLVSEGPDLNHQTVRLITPRGVASPRLRGTWFTSGFEGTMGELACAVDQQREPYHSARHNLPSLALAFAAIASADCGQPVRVGTVEQLRPEWIAG